jgi:hypothetical protein
MIKSNVPANLILKKKSLELKRLKKPLKNIKEQQQ